MNAVERLLAQGEQVLSLFDEGYRDLLLYGKDPGAYGIPQNALWQVADKVIASMPRGEYWASVYWLHSAIEKAWSREKPKPRASTKAIKRVGLGAADLFREYLTQREQLLAPGTWRRLLADVVFESREWEPLASRVVSLAERVAEEVQGIEQVPGETEPLLWGRRFRVGLRAALDSLHPYAQPPKPATSTSEKQPGGSRGRGGRPPNDEAQARDLLAGWKAFEPEDGKKTKDRYLAQRPDVRVLKTEDARQRRIASLRVALDSALHLRAEKARQKKRAHG
jgi:hypothetical protein